MHMGKGARGWSLFLGEVGWFTQGGGSSIGTGQRGHHVLQKDTQSLVSIKG